MRSRFPSSFFVNLTSEHWESLPWFSRHSPAAGGPRSGRPGWAGLAGPDVLRSRRTAKITVVTRMVTTDPTRALNRITMPVVLVELAQAEREGHGDRSSLAQMNQSISPRRIAVPIRRR